MSIIGDLALSRVVLESEGRRSRRETSGFSTMRRSRASREIIKVDVEDTSHVPFGTKHKDVVKVAVEMQGQTTQLVDLDQKESLEVIVEKLCEGGKHVYSYACILVPGLTFQVLLFCCLDDRIQTELDPGDPEQLDKVRKLYALAFDRDLSAQGSALFAENKGAIRRSKVEYMENYKKLGFTNHTSPILDFEETPPGLLALDCMLYFAENHTESYNKLVFENSCRDDQYVCPFARCAIALTLLLCKILQVGEPPSETGQDYHPMFFATPNAFEEVFCVCIQSLNKTWREMRAIHEDFDKVMDVCREQIGMALSHRPRSPAIFGTKLQDYSYHEIIRQIQDSRVSKLPLDGDVEPFCGLRNTITPGVVQLIKAHRLSHLVKGGLFQKFNKRRVKDKFWFCRLAPNFKAFHYGDAGEGTTPDIDQLSGKLDLADIKQLVTGKQCPHMKESRSQKDSVTPYAFSILYYPDNSLDFVAPTKEMYDLWTDGISALLDQEMTSKTTKKEMEMLLSMEMRLALLDTEGLQLPSEPPPLPPEPDNYDFAVKL
uniref:ELMO domain-containing protein n=1 Tax=Branchiostoma floridae TaxID=7739 RepID=C3YD81_BRAFL|eukprot:XP_002605682.1 hypothetical protein BRAFLDRAFT_121828 [Branchiostoma floridae]